MPNEVGAAFVALWSITLFMMLMTTPAQLRGGRTCTEWLGWRRARNRAATRRADLETKLHGLSIPLREETLDYLQREDTLYLASTQSMWKMAPILIFSLNSGGALMARALGSDLSKWREIVSIGVLFSPTGITLALMTASTNAGMRRWTTSILTATARRALEALLPSFVETGVMPPKDDPYNPPHIEAVRALGDFAAALEKYAVQRALPDGKRPIPEVVARYASAAALVRQLQAGVELDRVEGRARALAEVQRMIEILASGRVVDLAPDLVTGDSLLGSHDARRQWRKQVFVLFLFTLSVAGLVFAIAASGVAVAVATVAATALFGSWMKVFRLPTDQGENAPPTSADGSSATSEPDRDQPARPVTVTRQGRR